MCGYHVKARPCVWLGLVFVLCWWLEFLLWSVDGEACLCRSLLPLSLVSDKIVDSPGTGRPCLKRKLCSGFQEEKGVIAVATVLELKSSLAWWCVLVRFCHFCQLLPTNCLFCCIVFKVFQMRKIEWKRLGLNFYEQKYPIGVIPLWPVMPYLDPSAQLLRIYMVIVE